MYHTTKGDVDRVLESQFDETHNVDNVCHGSEDTDSLGDKTMADPPMPEKSLVAGKCVSVVNYVDYCPINDNIMSMYSHANVK